jgi:DDE superfamily endonuclease
VWVNGPFKATMHDKTIFSNGLLQRIPAGKRVIADSSYKKVPCISTHSSMDSEEVRRFKARVRSRHENFNERLERWESLKTCWKHGVVDDKHEIVLDAVAVLCAYQIELEEPLFDV